MANLVMGDRACWTEGVWHGGSFSRWGNRPGTFLGERTITGVISRSAYGERTTAHWLTVFVESAEGVEAPAPGTKLRRKAATVYGGLKEAEDGPEHAARAADKGEQKRWAARGAALQGNQARADQLVEQAARAWERKLLQGIGGAYDD